MSTLWQRSAKLTRPEPYLLICGVIVAGIIVDGCREPRDQVLARAYIGSAHLYQVYGRPLSQKVIRCRYRPTCSEYSVLAVERFGIFRGLKLTFVRLASCTNRVKEGSVDPVPLS
jgi:putative component of membrane protein insertase Oxa1/YidC/SpoIIIJ protein YidD